MNLITRIRARMRPAAPAPAPASQTPAPEDEIIAGHLVQQVDVATEALSDEIEAVIAAVRAERLSYLGVDMLRSLAAAVELADGEGIPGVVIETGTALGGSAIVLATAKRDDRTLHVYDVFGMIPPPGERDGEEVQERYRAIADGESVGLGGDTYYGYRSNLYDEVRESFARHGRPVEAHRVEMHRGLFEDTLVVDGPVALAHLDGDWYESTMTCLERIVPHLAVGGRLVIDDFDFWAGCRTAVEDYFDGRTGFRFERRERVHIIRTSAGTADDA